MTNREEVDTPNDLTLLLVSGTKGGKFEDKEYRKKLSNAILQVFSKHQRVTLRAVGAAAINNAIMAWTIADIDALKQGIIMAGYSSFVDVDFDGDIKTGMAIKILPLDEFVKMRKSSAQVPLKPILTEPDSE